MGNVSLKKGAAAKNTEACRLYDGFTICDNIDYIFRRKTEFQNNPNGYTIFYPYKMGEQHHLPLPDCNILTCPARHTERNFHIHAISNLSNSKPPMEERGFRFKHNGDGTLRLEGGVYSKIPGKIIADRVRIMNVKESPWNVVYMMFEQDVYGFSTVQSYVENDLRIYNESDVNHQSKNFLSWSENWGNVLPKENIAIEYNPLLFNQKKRFEIHVDPLVSGNQL